MAPVLFPFSLTFIRDLTTSCLFRSLVTGSFAGTSVLTRFSSCFWAGAAHLIFSKVRELVHTWLWYDSGLTGLIFENFLSDCSAWVSRPCASIVAWRRFSSDSGGLFRVGLGFGIGTASGLGKLEPFVPYLCGALLTVGSACFSFAGAAQSTQSTNAWLPLHPFFMHLCLPLSHSPPGPALDLQFPRLKP